jgi:hypothetical protein
LRQNRAQEAQQRRLGTSAVLLVETRFDEREHRIALKFKRLRQYGSHQLQPSNFVNKGATGVGPTWEGFARQQLTSWSSQATPVYIVFSIVFSVRQEIAPPIVPLAAAGLRECDQARKVFTVGRRESNPKQGIPIILPDNNLQERQSIVPAPGKRASDMVCQRLAIDGIGTERDALQFAIDAWPKLLPGVRSAIGSIVRAIVGR